MLADELGQFFERWQYLSMQIINQGTNNLNISTLNKLRNWQQHALLLGFSPLISLCEPLLSQESTCDQRVKALCQLLQYMEGLKKASVRQWIDNGIE